MNELISLSKILKRKKFEVEIFETGKLAKDKACKIIKDNIVGFGGSMTLDQIGLLDEINKFSKKVYSHIPGGAGEDEHNSLTVDYYLTSVNAISTGGDIVNIDGTGNRVAATCFGPKNIIYFIGKNKITGSLNEALVRAKETAVKLAKKYNRKTPCVTTGKCEDCLSPECICSITTIHRKKPNGINIYIFLINESLGL
ncbi:MAG: lactate utilization protein [bacterium]|nr:lactate utilization protein [bacterium]